MNMNLLIALELLLYVFKSSKTCYMGQFFVCFCFLDHIRKLWMAYKVEEHTTDRISKIHYFYVLLCINTLLYSVYVKMMLGKPIS